jgi:hypothetical protein
MKTYIFWVELEEDGRFRAMIPDLPAGSGVGTDPDSPGRKTIAPDSSDIWERHGRALLGSIERQPLLQARP